MARLKAVIAALKAGKAIATPAASDNDSSLGTAENSSAAEDGDAELHLRARGGDDYSGVNDSAGSLTATPSPAAATAAGDDHDGQTPLSRQSNSSGAWDGGGATPTPSRPLDDDGY